jgi:hypothetical protein
VYAKSRKPLSDEYFLDEGRPSSSRPLPRTTPKPLDRELSSEAYRDLETPDTSEAENAQFLLSPIPTEETLNPFPFNDLTDMTTTAKEVKLRAPTDFHGARELTTKFLQEVEMYMCANAEIYNTEEKKVLFVLSFMNGGVAGSWKQGKTAAYLKDGNFGTFDEFKQAVRTAFTPIDDEGVAKTELRTLRQGDMRIEEYIAQFTIISARTGLTEDSALIEYFINGLHPKLMERVYTMEKPPTTLEGWMRAASLFDGNWRHARTITNRNKSGSVKPSPVPDYVPQMPTRDPNAMDVDTIKRLSPEERLDHIKKGLCFICHKPGHLSSTHKKGGSTTPRNFQRRTAYQRICAITDELGEEEKDEIAAQMEKEGF